MSDWTEFIAWAEKLAPSLDLENDERNYKLAAAQRMREALTACRSVSGDWPVLLRRAIGSGNLVDAFAQTFLRNAIDAKPDAVRRAFADLAEDPQLHSIDAFDAAFTDWGDYVSPGNITTFASLVLMASEPAVNPPYRAQFTADWAKLVGVELGQSPRERYQGLRELSDALIAVWGERRPHVVDRLDAQGLAWSVIKYAAPVRWGPWDQAELTAWRAQSEPMVDRGVGVAPMMEAGAWEVLGRGLRGESSALAPDLKTWTAENARELRGRIENNPPGGGSFMRKLAGQMAGATNEVILLLAELLYLRNAPLTDMTVKTKVGRANELLSWGSPAESLPEPLADALNSADAFRGGQGYHNNTPSHLLWLSRFVEHWVGLTDEERVSALSDPFAFREVTASTPTDMATIRYVIEYLAWPGWFPSVVSGDHRQKIHAALLPDLGEPSGKDDRAITHDLVALQQFHALKDKGKGQRYAWYRSPYRERWQKDFDPAPRAWHVRVGEAGAEIVNRWMSEGFISLNANRLVDVPGGSPLPVVRAAVKSGYSHLDRSQQESTTRSYHDFLTGMKADDLVVTVNDGQARFGVIEGPPDYSGTDGSRLRRAVTWVDRDNLAVDLPDPLPALLAEQGQVVDVTSAYDLLADFVNIDLQDKSGADAGAEHPAGEVRPHLRAVTQDVADELFMAREPLQEIVDLLDARQQIVLYGPPGTGKTYVARALAKHLIGDPSRMRLVQFHPSYAYEDFFEGFRPYETDSGQPSFQLQSGPLKLIAEEALNPENRGEVFVLIIDEMNRANLAKVFGELYYLLEYRKDTIQLQYRQQDGEQKGFRLPPNLFIIGTMNTADRSIALVDAAIRRRFPFYEMHPSYEPVASVLSNFLSQHAVKDDRSALLDALNSAMGVDGHDLHIGPSYLMRDDVDAAGGIERVWKYDILPLLEEHFYGRKSRDALHHEFGIEALRAGLAKSVKEHVSATTPENQGGDDSQSPHSDPTS